MDTWYAIYVKESRELYSTGTVVATDEQLEENGLAKVAIDFDPQTGLHVWDPATLSFAERPQEEPA